MTRFLTFTFLFVSLLALALSVSGCGPDDRSVTVPMIMEDARITEIRSTGVTVAWTSSLEATAQVDWFYVPTSAFQTGLSLQDLLRQPGVTISNSAVFTKTMTKVHEYVIEGLEPGGWYALRLSCSNQRGARASVIGWNLVLNTFSTTAGPPESMGIVPSGDRESIAVGDGGLLDAF